ncbi:hypothetical protein Bca4012_009832 [Brassica carinata]
MLLLDEKSTLLQGYITFHRLNMFKHFLKEGSVYQLSGLMSWESTTTLSYYKQMSKFIAYAEYLEDHCASQKGRRKVIFFKSKRQN